MKSIDVILRDILFTSFLLWWLNERVCNDFTKYVGKYNKLRATKYNLYRIT